MEYDFISEVLFSVFEKDTKSFEIFIRQEVFLIIFCKNEYEIEEIVERIKKQFVYIISKLIKREDACEASSKIDVLLKIYKKVF